MSHLHFGTLKILSFFLSFILLSLVNSDFHLVLPFGSWKLRFRYVAIAEGFVDDACGIISVVYWKEMSGSGGCGSLKALLVDVTLPDGTLVSFFPSLMGLVR